MARNPRAAKSKGQQRYAEMQAALGEEERMELMKQNAEYRDMIEEERTRLKLKHAEYRRRRRAQLSEAELAHRRKQGAEYQRRRRAAIREGHLYTTRGQHSSTPSRMCYANRISAIETFGTVKDELISEMITSTTDGQNTSANRGIFPKVQNYEAITHHSLPANGILEPEITLVESNVEGFMNFLVAMSGNDASKRSSQRSSKGKTNDDNSDSEIIQGTTLRKKRRKRSATTAVDSDLNSEPMHEIDKTCEDFDNMFEA